MCIYVLSVTRLGILKFRMFASLFSYQNKWAKIYNTNTTTPHDVKYLSLYMLVIAHFALSKPEKELLQKCIFPKPILVMFEENESFLSPKVTDLQKFTVKTLPLSNLFQVIPILLSLLSPVVVILLILAQGWLSY